jgi:hypothetical protein
MKKRILLATMALMIGFLVVSCTGATTTNTPTTTTTAQLLSSITFSGVLETTSVGVHAIRYQVSVSGVVAQRWRYITVNGPEGVEGEMLINPNFDLGTAGWDDPAVVYNADGSSMTLTVDTGALKAEVIAGSNIYTPRFGQMNVPFEMGKTYEVRFDAKSSVAKTINCQVGELLSGAPYFTDFKPGITIHKELTTEWASYSNLVRSIVLQLMPQYGLIILSSSKRQLTPIPSLRFSPA